MGYGTLSLCNMWCEGQFIARGTTGEQLINCPDLFLYIMHKSVQYTVQELVQEIENTMCTGTPVWRMTTLIVR